MPHKVAANWSSIRSRKDECSTMGKGVDKCQRDPNNITNQNTTRRNDNGYSADSIVVVSELEAVRKRPAMYIGSTGDLGLHHLVYEAVDNSLDEIFAGFGDRVSVVVHLDNSVSIKDNGRGLSIEKHYEDGRSAAELALTVLSCGSRRRLCAHAGAGLSVVNFLSEWLQVVIWRDGNRYEQEYQRGLPDGGLRHIRKTRRHGTKITFKPDPDIFQVTEFNFRILSQRMREVAALNPGISIVVADERTDKSDEFVFQDGFAGFVSALNKNTAVVHDRPIHFVRPASQEDPLGIEIAIQYAERHGETICSFANDLQTADGGTHVNGFCSGLVRAINDYAKSSGALRHEGKELAAADLFEGLFAAVSVKLLQPCYEGCTRVRLLSKVSEQVEAFVYDGLMSYFDRNSIVARRIVGKLISGASRVRDRAMDR